MNTARVSIVRQSAGPSPQHPLCRGAVLVALAAITMSPQASAQVWMDVTIDHMVFPLDRTADGARARLKRELSEHVSQIDRACRLTEEQQRKLLLAGRGDIKRFFDCYEQVKEKALLTRDKLQKQEKLQAGQDDAAEKAQMIALIEQVELELMLAVGPVREALQAGLFHEDSLLCKSVRRTLTDEQVARYEGLEQERRATRHRAGIERAVGLIGRTAPMREAQRQDLILLLAAEIAPPRKAASSPYDGYYTLYMMGRMPEEKLKPLFKPEQWAAVSTQVKKYQRLEVNLRQRGLLPAGDGAGSEDAPPPPGVVKK